MEKFHASEKLSELAQFCKEKYRKEGLLKHNWSHIVRNIYRAEKIAETEENVDMETLYAANMLHDIGVTVGKYEDHDENSRKVAREKLPELGFSEKETEKILEVLKEFEEVKEIESIEAKILSDADKLEKSSLPAVWETIKVHLEWDKDKQDMVKDFSRYREWAEEGFYTEKAAEINNGGIREVIDFMESFRSRLKTRQDFIADEEDLKLEFQGQS